MDDPRWEPGMPVLDRQAGGPATGRAATTTQPVPGPLPPSLQGLPVRSVPEMQPTPLQRSYINLSVVALVAGVVAITAVELGARLGSPLVKLCVLVAAPILVATTADATLRIWRSARAWMAVDRGKGWFRLAWVAVASIGLVLIVIAAIVVITA